jgi:membrane protease YdiL (CAAX protease family)
MRGPVYFEIMPIAAGHVCELRHPPPILAAYTAGNPMIEVALFVAGLFGLPWLMKAVLPPPSGTLSSFLVSFVPSVWTPSMLAIVFVLARGGSSGLRRELAARLRYSRQTGGWILRSAPLCIAAVAIAVFSARTAGDRAPFIDSDGLMQAIGLQIVTGAVGEELGWRGYLLPRLERLTGTTQAAWIMGGLWSLWHVPAFFDKTLPHYFMPMFLVLPFIACFGAFIGLVFFRSARSILATISPHLTLNIMLALGGVSLTSRVFWGVLATIFAALAILMTFLSMTREPRQDDFVPSPV